MLLVDLVFLLVCICIVLLSAEFAIKSSIVVARHFGLSDNIIGMTILSIGTSLPEIITHVIGSINIIYDPQKLESISSLVVGANVGSDMFQQNFLLGFIAVLGIVYLTKKHLFTNIGGLIGATVILMLFSFNGTISRLEGFILAGGYIIYLYYINKYEQMPKEEIEVSHEGLWKNIFILLVSFIAMAYSADKVLLFSDRILDYFSISASFFGLVVIGIAAALPELITSVLSILSGKKEMGAGVLIGSNITNPMLALGLGAMISSYSIPTVILIYDLPFKIFTAFILFYFFFRFSKINKNQGLIMMTLFLIYIAIRSIYFQTDVF
jgi:cation:H+ antiporter